GDGDLDRVAAAVVGDGDAVGHACPLAATVAAARTGCTRCRVGPPTVRTRPQRRSGHPHRTTGGAGPEPGWGRLGPGAGARVAVHVGLPQLEAQAPVEAVGVLSGGPGREVDGAHALPGRPLQ